MRIIPLSHCLIEKNIGESVKPFRPAVRDERSMECTVLAFHYNRGRGPANAPSLPTFRTRPIITRQRIIRRTRKGLYGLRRRSFSPRVSGAVPSPKGLTRGPLAELHRGFLANCQSAGFALRKERCFRCPAHAARAFGICVRSRGSKSTNRTSRRSDLSLRSSPASAGLFLLYGMLAVR
jgi:hypothetical protein